jgi:hypothetical protein
MSLNRESGKGQRNSTAGAATLGVAAQHVRGDLLSLRVETEVTNLLSDPGCCGGQPRLRLHTRPDEVFEDELDGGQRTPAVGSSRVPDSVG